MPDMGEAYHGDENVPEDPYEDEQPRHIYWPGVVALDTANAALIPLLNAAWALKDDTARTVMKAARHTGPQDDADESLEEVGRAIRHLALDIEHRVTTILRDLTVLTRR